MFTGAGAGGGGVRVDKTSDDGGGLENPQSVDVICESALCRMSFGELNVCLFPNYGLRGKNQNKVTQCRRDNIQIEAV